MRPKAILFDCFGVLYNNALSAFYEEHKSFFLAHRAYIDRSNSAVNLGETTREAVYHEFERLSGGSITFSAIREEINDKLTLDKQLVDFIKHLSSRYRIGLLSNAGKEEIEIIYRDHIDDLFDAITVSYQVKAEKPNPAIYLACAKSLAVVTTDCLLVDDSSLNLAGAQKVGMRTIHYPSFGSIPEALRQLGTT